MISVKEAYEDMHRSNKLDSFAKAANGIETFTEEELRAELQRREDAKMVKIKCYKCKGVGIFNYKGNGYDDWHQKCDVCKGAKFLLVERAP